jgi:hypothetical protein
LVQEEIMREGIVLWTPAFGKPGLKVRLWEGSQGKEIQFINFLGGEENVLLTLSRKQFVDIIIGLGFWVKKSRLDPQPKSGDLYEF